MLVPQNLELSHPEGTLLSMDSGPLKQKIVGPVVQVHRHRSPEDLGVDDSYPSRVVSEVEPYCRPGVDSRRHRTLHIYLGLGVLTHPGDEISFKKFGGDLRTVSGPQHRTSLWPKSGI
jgi:hypothetical protein